MIHRLAPEEYEPTKSKLADLEQRLSALERRTDLPASRLRPSVRSYREMIAQLRAEIQLFDAMQTFEATQAFADKS